jgi:VCBS repeat-containing protein
MLIISGADSFVVQVADGLAGWTIITVDVAIEAVNDAPVLTPVGT